MSFYGSAENVRRLTGTRPSDFGFETELAYNEWIEARLAEIKVLIDKDRNRDDFDVQGWLPAINNVADRWMAGQIRFMMAHRDSPIIRVEDFDVETPTDAGPGAGVLADLRRFPRKHTKRFVLSSNVAKKAVVDE